MAQPTTRKAKRIYSVVDEGFNVQLFTSMSRLASYLHHYTDLLLENESGIYNEETPRPTLQELRKALRATTHQLRFFERGQDDWKLKMEIHNVGGRKR